MFLIMGLYNPVAALRVGAYAIPADPHAVAVTRLVLKLTELAEHVIHPTLSEFLCPEEFSP
jgi:hypothetical protein